MNFYKMSRSGINSQGRLSSPNRERKIINRHVFTFSTKPITCRERQRIEPKCKTHVQRHCFRSLPLPSWLRKLPDTTQLFRTSNFIGPVYHAALLFEGQGSIVVLFVLLFSSPIRGDLVIAAYCPKAPESYYIIFVLRVMLLCMVLFTQNHLHKSGAFKVRLLNLFGLVNF